MSKLTKRIVDTLSCEVGEAFAWDGELKGFGVRVKASGAKSFVCQYRNRNGRSRRVTIARYGVLTTDEARHEARQILADVARGSDPASDKARDRSALTMRALCQEYMAKAEAGLIRTRRRTSKSASTVATDRGRVERHIVPLLGHRVVEDVKQQDIRAFVRAIEEGKTKVDVRTGPRGRARVKGGSGTATRTTGLLGSILSYAVEEGYRSDNPVRGVILPGYNKRYARLSPEQFCALGEALKAAETRDPRRRGPESWQAILAIRLLALTGARRGEIANLLRADVDIPGSALRLSTSKTGRSVRPLGAAALSVLKDAMSRSSGVYVFPAIRGDDVNEPFGGLPKAWERIVKPALPEATAHVLRHSFASVADEVGCSEATIATMLGHSAGTVTRGYIHKLDEALVAAATKVSGVINEMMKW